jgi:hypothetical protein
MANASTWHQRTCPACHRPFQCHVKGPQPSHCGRPVCRAAVDWTADQWAAYRPMVDARVACGLELDAMDVLCLDRTP